MLLSSLLYRCFISSVCIILLSDLSNYVGISLQEVVLSVATLDLVVGELDR